jgi:glycosyltransferase involved in cell wall biosynthesis
MLLLLKLLNKPIVVTIHGVIPLSQLNKIFMKENRINGNLNILKFGLFSITKMICSFSNIVIVHEKYFKTVLSKQYKIQKKRICVIPHGIEERNDVIKKSKAKEILRVKNKKVLLFFGYLAGYKGIETLIDVFQYIKDKNCVLFIAGGYHPRLKRDSKYLRYIETLKKRAKNTSQNIIFTGHVPEEKISLYFSSADLVIFPYKVAMASSGPMTFAISYEKPFIVSESMKNILSLPFMTFENNPKSLAKKIEIFFRDKRLINFVIKKIKVFKKRCLWLNIVKNTIRVYENL